MWKSVNWYIRYIMFSQIQKCLQQMALKMSGLMPLFRIRKKQMSVGVRLWRSCYLYTFKVVWCRCVVCVKVLLMLYVFTDVDECTSSPCIAGTCINEAGSFRCICDPGFTLDNTRRICLGMSCWNNINPGKIVFWYPYIVIIFKIFIAFLCSLG